MRRNRGFSVLEAMVAVAILGVIVSVAVPTYLKFVDRAKHGEAANNLKLISNGAVSYFHGDHYNDDGVVVRGRFPESTKTTPRTSPCNSGKTRYSASPYVWRTPTWKALGFGISGPHYFQYRFESVGTYYCASFKAYAEADFSCSGQKSELRLLGRADPATGEVVLSGLVVNGAKLTSNNGHGNNVDGYDCSNRGSSSDDGTEVALDGDDEKKK